MIAHIAPDWSVRLRAATLDAYPSLNEAARELGIHPGTFRKCCVGKYVPNTLDREKLRKRFGELGIPAAIPQWAHYLDARIRQKYGNALAASNALGINYTSLRNQVLGRRVPTTDMRAILTAAFPGLELPPAPPDRFAARLAEMVTKQQAELERTGHLPTYLLSEIGGTIMSRERVRQIEVVAKAKIIHGLLLNTPQLFRDEFGFPQWVIDELTDIPMGVDNAGWFVDIFMRILDKVTADKRRTA